MTRLHNTLMEKNSWYAAWHRLPDAQSAHWGVFVLSVALMTLSVFA